MIAPDFYNFRGSIAAREWTKHRLPCDVWTIALELALPCNVASGERFRYGHRRRSRRSALAAEFMGSSAIREKGILKTRARSGSA